VRDDALYGPLLRGERELVTYGAADAPTGKR
jgi:hypothetical protein